MTNRPTPSPPPFPRVADGYLRRFLSELNYQMPHPLDVQRFYMFVAVCHQTRVSRRHDVKAALLHAGVPERHAVLFETIYGHGREVLKIAPAASQDMQYRRLGAGPYRRRD